MSDEILFTISSQSRLSDVRALLDSYGVELLKSRVVVQRIPIHFCKLDEGQNWSGALFPNIDNGVELRLIRFEIPVDDFLSGIRERNARWPFWVEHPLKIRLRVGDQWWQFRFTPGKNYEEREMARRTRESTEPPPTVVNQT